MNPTKQDVLLERFELDRLRLKPLPLIIAAELLVAQRRTRPLGFVAPVSRGTLLGWVDWRDRVVVCRVERVEIDRARRRRRRRGCRAVVRGGQSADSSNQAQHRQLAYWSEKSGSES